MKNKKEQSVTIFFSFQKK